jgi:hypothetical protein
MHTEMTIGDYFRRQVQVDPNQDFIVYPDRLLRWTYGQFDERTGNLAKRYAKTEPVDPVATVPDALWKLALCHLEQGDTAQAKATAERLLKLYGTSREAQSAQKLLATLTPVALTPAAQN